MIAHDIIVKPLITEKSMSDLADGKYSFVVDPRATKTQIKLAIEEVFKVRVTQINTMNCYGKTRRMGKTQGRKPDWKKAIVKLAPGQKIEFFEGLS